MQVKVQQPSTTTPTIFDEDHDPVYMAMRGAEVWECEG